MKVSWPFGVALRREASSRLMLRWLKTVVVSDEEKASVEASGGDREGERERIVADVSKPLRRHQNRGVNKVLGGVWRWSAYWPGGVRHIDDASPVCGFRMEQEKACPDTGRSRAWDRPAGSSPSG